MNLAQAFNAWQDDYIKNPAKYEAEWESVRRTLAERADGKEPSYGDLCVAVLEELGYTEKGRA